MVAIYLSDREELLSVADAAVTLGVSVSRVKQLICDRNRRLIEKTAESDISEQLIGRKIGKKGTWILTKDELEMIRPMANGRPKKGGKDNGNH